MPRKPVGRLWARRGRSRLKPRRFATKTLTTLRALVPWSEKLVGAGVESMKGISLPLEWRAEMGNGSAPAWDLSVRVTPRHLQPVSGLIAGEVTKNNL